MINPTGNPENSAFERFLNNVTQQNKDDTKKSEEANRKQSLENVKILDDRLKAIKDVLASIDNNIAKDLDVRLNQIQILGKDKTLRETLQETVGGVKSLFSVINSGFKTLANPAKLFGKAATGIVSGVKGIGSFTSDVIRAEKGFSAESERFAKEYERTGRGTFKEGKTAFADITNLEKKLDVIDKNLAESEKFGFKLSREDLAQKRELIKAIETIRGNVKPTAENADNITTSSEDLARVSKEELELTKQSISLEKDQLDELIQIRKNLEKPSELRKEKVGADLTSAAAAAGAAGMGIPNIEIPDFPDRRKAPPVGGVPVEVDKKTPKANEPKTGPTKKTFGQRLSNLFELGKDALGKGATRGKDLLSRGATAGKDVLDKGATRGKDLLSRGATAGKDLFGRAATFSKDLFGRVATTAAETVVPALRAAAPVAGATAAIGAAVAAPFLISAMEKKKIDEDLYNPKYDNNPYAISERSKKSGGPEITQGQAGKRNADLTRKRIGRSEIEEVVSSKMTDADIIEQYGASRAELSTWLKNNPEPSKQWQAPVKNSSAPVAPIDKNTNMKGAEIYNESAQNIALRGGHGSMQPMTIVNNNNNSVTGTNTFTPMSSTPRQDYAGSALDRYLDKISSYA